LSQCYFCSVVFFNLKKKKKRPILITVCVRLIGKVTNVRDTRCRLSLNVFPKKCLRKVHIYRTSSSKIAPVKGPGPNNSTCTVFPNDPRSRHPHASSYTFGLVAHIIIIIRTNTGYPYIYVHVISRYMVYTYDIVIGIVMHYTRKHVASALPD